MMRTIATCLVMLCIAGQASAQPIFSSPPLFSDTQLQQCLLDTATAAGWTQTGDVTYLRCPQRNIQDTFGIEVLVNLTALDLSGNALAALPGVHSFTGLTELMLSDNPDLDIAEINGLLTNNTGITHLGLGGIAVGDLYALPLYNPQTGSDYDLIELDISNTGITSFNRLTDFPNLRRLNLADNRISMLDPWILEALPALQALDLSNNALTGLSGLSLHTGLIELNVSHNRDIDPAELNAILVNNTGLTHLGLAGVRIDTLYSLALYDPQTGNDYDLIELDLSHTGVSNLDRLPMFPNLRRLNLGSNDLQEIWPWLLEQLTQLAAIDLSDNALIDISGLDFHTRLTELNLSHNAAIDSNALMPLLANNTGLTHLGLAGIVIDNFNALPLYDPFDGTDYALVELDISHTGIRDLSRLPAFDQLRRLGLSGNNISQIDPWYLEPLAQLNAIDLSDNRLSDITGLDFHTTLVEFNVSNNLGLTSAMVFPVLASNHRLTHLGLGGIGIDDLYQLPLYNPYTGRDFALVELDINRSGVSNIDRLNTFITLRRLDLSGNQLGNIAPATLQSLNALTALDLSHNGLTRITGLESHTGLRELYLSDNAGIDINTVIPILANNRHLTHLGLGNIALMDLGMLPLFDGMTGRHYRLVELDLSNTGVIYLTQLTDFPDLERLNLSGNQLNSIDPLILETLSKLTVLDLSNNALTQLAGLDFHTGLRELNLSNNAGIDIYSVIPVLATNTGLTHLGLGGIAMTDFALLPLFEPMSGQHYRLVELDLSNTGVSNLAGLAAFTELRMLNLAGNQLKDLGYPSFVAPLVWLSSLNLADNNLSSIESLYEFTYLTELNLFNNEQMQCSDLDVLENIYGSSNVTRPDNCLILNPPLVVILEPASLSTVFANRLITFTGSASDPEDGLLDTMLTWSSDLDGMLGSGGQITRKLSQGTHVITAGVIDSHGNAGNFAISLTAVAGPDGDINADGSVDTADILLATQVLMGQATLTPQQMIHADVAPLVNGVPLPDALFTIGDLLIIKRKALGKIDF